MATVRLSIETDGVENVSAEADLEEFARLSALGRVRTLGQMWEKIIDTVVADSDPSIETGDESKPN